MVDISELISKLNAVINVPAPSSGPKFKQEYLDAIIQLLERPEVNSLGIPREKFEDMLDTIPNYGFSYVLRNLGRAYGRQHGLSFATSNDGQMVIISRKR
jgi:hypothetical protein